MQSVTSLPKLRIASLRSRDYLIADPAVNRTSHLAVHTAEGIQVIGIAEIVRAEADSNYCSIYYGPGHRVVVSRTLKAVEELLPADQFARIHQSHVIRISEIRLVRKDEVVLLNGKELPLSRHQRSALIEHLQSFTAKI